MLNLEQRKFLKDNEPTFCKVIIDGINKLNPIDRVVFDAQTERMYQKIHPNHVSKMVKPKITYV
jgi:hypothetical protein